VQRYSFFTNQQKKLRRILQKLIKENDKLRHSNTIYIIYNIGRKDILKVRQDGDTKKIGFRMIRRTL
jgi:hypothetical protein